MSLLLLVDEPRLAAAHHVGTAVQPQAVGPRNLGTQVRYLKYNKRKASNLSDLIVDHDDPGIGLGLAALGEVGGNQHRLELVLLDFWNVFSYLDIPVISSLIHYLS